ncbi:MAG: TlpA family protein disulfide reductase [Bacteroidetes bacterium]|nr:TlpA family protein disulfide reductase [Bacteroidota bacterium]MCL2302600.1 TlpA family protein disulfide reductase [Lentimicrobiaceae bacterium]
MKKVFLFLLVMSILAFSFAQEKAKATLPSVEVRTLDGKTFNTKDIQNNGKPILVSLWATWCKPCVAELMAINDVYDEWQEETGVVLYAISIDDTRTAAKVAPFVNGRGWDYKVLQDINGDLKRAMNVIDVPFLCLLNGNGEIVWSHTSYAPGSEKKVFELVKKVAKGEEIKN